LEFDNKRVQGVEGAFFKFLALQRSLGYNPLGNNGSFHSKDGGEGCRGNSKSGVSGSASGRPRRKVGPCSRPAVELLEGYPSDDSCNSPKSPPSPFVLCLIVVGVILFMVGSIGMLHIYLNKMS